MVVAKLTPPDIESHLQQISLVRELTLFLVHVRKLVKHGRHLDMPVITHGTRDIVHAHEVGNKKLLHMPLNSRIIILVGELAFPGIFLGQHVILQRSKEERSLFELQLPRPKDRVRPNTFVMHKPEQFAPKPTLFHELE
eukprot:CAMPEP_0169443268 /NCGR_PEP_ID=MMETSP1042-20121227/9265_1 /TAXON_ID=464988 /ORGANISM="Hemiselmis andersenii, Strain CCMP1180" /LENGTH=138 /DNA_ID=CAMNT_0009554485 /DNA_START=84 /DNA_END=500 /DNA_ORIENTATION=-